jgi:hypothetical protein
VPRPGSFSHKGTTSAAAAPTSPSTGLSITTTAAVAAESQPLEGAGDSPAERARALVATGSVRDRIKKFESLAASHGNSANSSANPSPAK